MTLIKTDGYDVCMGTIRRAAVAGRFYPASSEELSHTVDQHLGQEQEAIEKEDNPLGCVVPHAGYMYSGNIAGAVYRRLPPRSTYIILCPNHKSIGAQIALMPKGEWLTPLGSVSIDDELSERLQQTCHLIEEDAKAHQHEHSLEVQLPFLQRTATDFSFVPIALGIVGFAALESLGHSLAEVAKETNKSLLTVASSDMNHYESDGVTRIKDFKAIDKILQLDPEGLYHVLHRENISMCGYGPTIAMLTAAKDLGARRAELVKYGTSADASGDRSAVVGYAGIIVS